MSYQKTFDAFVTLFPMFKDDIADYFYNVNDFDKAIKWYKSSAEEENLYAQKKLGYIYYNGEVFQRRLIVR